MSKIAKRPSPAVKSAPAPAEKTTEEKAAEKPKETFRDMVDQIAVAIILAILIRGFDAEAFVIPTGSMAPTLKGRHKEITCPQCSHVYTVNSSDDAEAYLIRRPEERKEEAAICDNCRYLTPIGFEPSFKGDRILVMKFPYEFPTLPGAGGPNRWDVVVFHYPEKPAETNYIKRLVGMPDEDLRIQRGNVWIRPAGSNDAFRIARKPLSRQRAMAIMVNDDSHRPALLKGKPEWARWKTAKGFSEKSEGTFVVEGDGELRYSNLIPDPEQWAAIARQTSLPRPPRATLITDFYSYNSNTINDRRDPTVAWEQTDWVGDLMVNMDLKVEKNEGTVTLELVEAGVQNRCEIDLKTGMAVMFHGDAKLGEAQTRMTSRGWYALEFANIDDRLTLTVDGATPFGDGLEYIDAPGAASAPTAEDLAPVAVTSRGAAVQVSGLVLKRDIYYTLYPSRPDCPISVQPTFGSEARSPFWKVVQQFDILSDPARFGPLFANVEASEPYTIRPDHFMMMGDNSPRSADSRAWGRGDMSWDPDDRSRWEVPRPLLIGRAFFVYWPHGVPFFPKIPLSQDFLIPFRPYFERMKPIR